MLSQRLDLITKHKNILQALLIKKDRGYKPNKMLAIAFKIIATLGIKN